VRAWGCVLIASTFSPFQQNIEKANAEEFYEVYKGVVAEYQSMVNELSTGASLALEITGKDADTPARFRELCGPADPVNSTVVKIVNKTNRS